MALRGMRPIPTLLSLVGGLALLLGAPVGAQLPAARLDAVFPAGAAPGTTLDVTIHGADLDDVASLLFSTPGITAAPKKVDPGPFDQGPQTVPDTFVVTVAADVHPGPYTVRCQGRYGVSAPRTFLVDPSPHVLEIDAGEGPRETEIPVPGIADGRFSGGPDVDLYTFTGKAGQKLSVDGIARRVDSRAALVLRLETSDGRFVAEARAGAASDPRIDVALPADGAYRLTVSDAVHGNGPDHPYEIRVSSAPRLAFVFPPVVAPGATVDAVAWGWNLPGGRPSPLTRDGQPLEEMPVKIAMPADVVDKLPVGERVEPWQFGLDGVELRVAGPSGPSNTLLVPAADGPVAVEAPDNDTPRGAQALTLPAEVVGRFHPRRDVDWYRFDAKAGEVLWIEVWSHRLGAPTDVSLLVQQVILADDGSEKTTTVASVDDGPPRQGGREFDERSFDPSLRFVAPADGTYRLLLRDGYAALHDDPGLVYRLVVRSPRPDFRLVAFPVDASGSVLLRKGGAAAVEVVASRRDGFAGDITLSAQGLPGGTSAGDVVLGGGVSMTRLVLAAAAGAPPGSGTLRVVGRAATPAGEVTRTARSAICLDPLPFAQPGGQNPGTRARLVDGVAVAVSAEESAPVALSIGAGTPIETARGGVVKIPYTVVRQEGAGAAITGFPIGLPPNTGAPQVAIGGANSGEFEVRFQANTPPGTYSFHLAAMQQGLTYARNPAAAAAAKERAESFAAVLADAQTKLQTAQQSAQQAAAAVNAAGAGTDQAAKDAAAKARQEADAALQAAQERVRLAQAEKQRRDQAAQQAQQQAAPKGVNVVVPSTPVTVRIAEYPLRVGGLPAAVSATQGTPFSIPFTLERLHGFAGDVTVRCEVPAGTAGIPAAQVTVPAAMNGGTLMVPLAADASPGTHDLKLAVSLAFNGQALTLPASVAVTVVAAAPPAAK